MFFFYHHCLVQHRMEAQRQAELRRQEELRRQQEEEQRQKVEQQRLAEIRKKAKQQQFEEQKEFVNSIVGDLAKKKVNDCDLFINVINDYLKIIGNNRMDGIKKLSVILEENYNFDLPNAVEGREKLNFKIREAIKSKIPLSLAEYKKSRYLYYEKEFPLFNIGDVISITTRRQRSFSGVFKGFKLNGTAVKVGIAIVHLNDLDPIVAMRFNKEARDTYISNKVKGEENYYRRKYQLEEEQQIIKVMTSAGYFYYKGSFYSPRELYELCIQ